MKDILSDLLKQACIALQNDGILPADLALPEPQIEHTRDPAHGDYASNLAMALARAAKQPPRELAGQLLQHLPAHRAVSRVTIAGPGFINFFLDHDHFFEIVALINANGPHYGRSEIGAGRKVQVEFVSANPTGPLHVGHGRGAACGDTLARILSEAGFDVQREYYVNDAGRQMNILAASVWVRYLNLAGHQLPFPANGYQGEYIIDIARALHDNPDVTLDVPQDAVLADLPADEAAGGDREQFIDALVQRARDLLGPDRWACLHRAGLEAILADIREDLGDFGVTYDQWFSEASVAEAIPATLTELQERGHLYQKDGATWFRSTAFGDDKDRVVQRENGEYTYFASDIAYHRNKFQRGFERIINIWGADHHGYILRVRAALEALGLDPQRLTVQLVQFAILYRGGERVQMSTRSGSFVTLRALREEVGKDAARFFYVTRKTDQHMDFDLDLARSQSKDNPVYYIQYAHARICSMLEKYQESLGSLNAAIAAAIPAGTLAGHLTLAAEKDLCVMLARYPECVAHAAENLEAHGVTHYLRELAGAYHSYYNAEKIIGDDPALSQARASLSLAVRQVLANGLLLLGVSAPERM